MKKITKGLGIILTSLTTLTGCKGDRITGEEAFKVIDDILDNYSKAYEEIGSFTMTIKDNLSGEEEAKKSITVECDMKNKVFHYSSFETSDDEENKRDFYIGIKKENLYIIDVYNEEYVVFDENVDKMFSEYVKYYKEYMLLSQYTSMQLTLMSYETYVAAEEVLGEKEDSIIKLYSKGEGNLYAQSTIKQDEIFTETNLTIDDYLLKELSATIDEGDNKITSKVTINYSASAKLPSINNYYKEDHIDVL